MSIILLFAKFIKNFIMSLSHCEMARGVRALSYKKKPTSAMLEGGKINHFVALLCDGFCGEYITLYYRIVLNFQLIAESGGQLLLN